MNNGNNWAKNNRRNRDPQRGNGRPRNGGGSKQNRRTNEGAWSDGGKRNFQKFVDINRPKNESNYWSQSDRNCDNQNIQHHSNGGGIFPWVRKNPFNPLAIPQYTSFEEPNDYKETPIKNKEEKVENTPESVKTSLHHESEKSTSNTAINSASTENTESIVKVSGLHYENSSKVQVKQEKNMVMNLKQEKKSSSSSSSSSASSSSEKETRSKNKTTIVKPDLTTNSKPPTSPLNIKLKTKASSPTSTPLKTNQKLKATSKSSSSSDEESTPPPKSVVDKKETTQVARKEVKSKSGKKKNSSEEDVVCIGNLESKIVLEDESDSADTTDEERDDKAEEMYKEILNKNIKKTSKKSVEICMICDKKGHTSFQCQMICKNCSEPYHGYRTCPQPANLNTMLQIFMEFCMQQFQHFNIEKLSTTNRCNSVAKAQVDTLQSSVNMKSNKVKRKPLKASESNEKIKTSKKRKLSPAKKLKSKNDSDDENDEEYTASEISAADSKENTSDSIAESIISSKKKRKTKSKNTVKNALNLSNFSTNPVNLPMVLNSFPSLTVPTVSVQNPSTSANALNTLLLTQMFQNAIGSLKQ